MFLSETKGFPYSLGISKYIMEIALKDSEFFYEFYNTKQQELAWYGKTIEETHPFVIMKRFLQSKGMKEQELRRVGELFSSSLKVFNVDNLMHTYMSIGFIEQEIKSSLSYTIAEKHRVSSISDASWTQVYLSMKDTVLRTFNINNYDPASEGLLEFIIHGLQRYYVPKMNPDILTSLRSEGLNQESEGNDFGMIDYQSIETSSLPDLKGFTVIARSIYHASFLLFEHNGKIMYDLFSRYKKSVLDRRAAEVRTMIEERLPKVSTRTRDFVIDVNRTIVLRNVNASEETARKKLEFRDELIKPLDRILQGDRDILSMLVELRQINAVKVTARRGKDKQAFLDYGDYVSRDKYSNAEKEELVVTGFLALSQLVKFLTKNKIDPLTVPSDVFKDPKLSIRLDSFRWYMAALEPTKDLIARETPNMGDGLMPNNVLYATIMSPNSEALNSISLGQIKALLTTNEERDKHRTEKFFDTSIIQQVLRKLDPINYAAETRSIILRSYLLERPDFPRTRAAMIRGLSVTDTRFYSVRISGDIGNFFKAWYTPKGEDPTPIETNRRIKTNYYLANQCLESGANLFPGYLRVMSVLEAIISRVEKILRIVGPASYTTITNEFSLMLALSSNPGLLPFPVDAKNFEEISPVLGDIELFLVEGMDKRILNEQIVRLFKKLMEDFRPYLEYCNKLHQSCMTRYFKFATETLNTEEATPDMLRKQGVKMYSYLESDVPLFQEIKRSVSVDSGTGFLMEGKKYFKREFEGRVYYLHERGYWVNFIGDTVNTVMAEERHF